MSPSEPSPCVLCGSAAATHVFSKVTTRLGVPIDLVRCTACGHVYLQDWQRHFSEAVYDYYGNPERRLTERDPITELRYEALLADFDAPGRRLLDVGCGAGQFVEAAQKAGWNAQGIELSGPAADLCQSLGLDVRKLDLFDESLAPGSYDVVTAFEVLEHVTDPRAFSARMASLLRPGGVMHITVPNWRSLDRMLLGPDWRQAHFEHISYFTPASMREILTTTGLRVERSVTRNISTQALKRALGKKADPARARADHIEMRQAIESKPAIGAAKRVANATLAATGLGSSLNVWARWPG